MSSRVYRPDGGHLAVPMLWRQVHSRPADEAGSGPGGQEIASEQLAELARQYEQKVAEARAAGFGEGEAKGRRAAAAELQPVMERLARSIEEMAGYRGSLRRQAERDMLQLSLAIARRVLHRQLALDPEALHGLVLAALEKLESQEISRVQVHPSMAPQVRALLEKTVAGARIQVVADPARESGALVFETERGNLDASVESQLREIERGLADRLERRA